MKRTKSEGSTSTRGTTIPRQECKMFIDASTTHKKSLSCKKRIILNNCILQHALKPLDLLQRLSNLCSNMHVPSKELKITEKMA